MNCTYCKKPIGCGCNKAVAQNNSVVCKGCLNIYNQQLIHQQTSTTTSKDVQNNSRQITIAPTTAR